MKKYLLVVKIFLLYIVIYYYFIGKVEISGLFFKSTINKAIKQSKANNEIHTNEIFQWGTNFITEGFAYSCSKRVTEKYLALFQLI